jgi:hypothetical protein
MKPQLPSGLQRGLPFLIAADGSAEQALAVFELLTDLREVIWRQYQIPIQDLLQQQARPAQAAVDSDARYRRSPRSDASRVCSHPMRSTRWLSIDGGLIVAENECAKFTRIYAAANTCNMVWEFQTSTLLATVSSVITM